MTHNSQGGLPDFLFIGAMKSATSTMSYQLGRQPGIHMVSNPKELYFFSYDHNYAQGEGWYRSKFAGAEAGDICGEAATTYTQIPTYPAVVERMYQLIPQVKMIYIMRHPIDRLVSQYLHECTLQRIKVDINQAIYKHPELIFYSLYAMQLQPFIDKFGGRQILPSFFERLAESAQQELERICQFICYPDQPTWDFEAEAKNVTKKRPISTPWIRFLRKSKALSPIREHLVPQWLKSRVNETLASNLEKPEISKENIQYLKSIFDRDLSILGEWLGVELNCDNFKEVVKSKSLEWQESVATTRVPFSHLNILEPLSR